MLEKHGFEKLERVFAPLTALLVFALNEMRLFQDRPRAPAPDEGFTHAAVARVFNANEQIFLSGGDVALRWFLFAAIVALGIWTLAETLPPRKRAQN